MLLRRVLALALICICLVATRGVRIKSSSLSLSIATGSAEQKPYGDQGPDFSHVRQGRLGDCYFLSGIAAIAYRHPDIIENLFVDGDLWSSQERPVFTMRFLINGEETRVVVDDMVPVLSDRRGFAFARAESGDDVWPLLMEKGFAKMFGSYMRIVGGRVYDSFKAVTQAPVDLLEVDSSSATDFWSALVDAERNLWPMSSGSRHSTKVGVTPGHQFVILETSEDYDGHGKAVHVYNPWATNQYTGVLASDQAKGNYWITYDEFREAFEDVTVARIQPGYQISSKQIQVGVPTLLQLTMTTNMPFAVQLEWPTSRFLPEACNLGKPHLKLLVAKASDLTKAHVGKRARWSHISNARADVDGGAGDYFIFVFADFEGSPWLESVVVNTYSAEKVVIRPSTQHSAIQTASSMLGFNCDDIMWTSGQGEKQRSMWFTRRDALNGSPAWKELAGDAILWFDHEEWRISVSEAEPNRIFTNFQGPSELTCIQAHPRLDCEDVFWIDERGSKEKFRRRDPVQGSPAWRHVFRDDMILWFAGEKQYRMIASESEPSRFYPSFQGPSQLQCADPLPRFDDCKHLIWTDADGHKQRFTYRMPMQGSAAWKHTTRSDILWFAQEAEYRIIPSESQPNRFYPSFEGPSQLKCADKQALRFTCYKLRWTDDRGRKYDFVRRSPFRDAPAWRETRKGMLLWFNTEWQVSPSEEQPNSYFPSFKPEQLKCLPLSLLQEAELGATPAAAAAESVSATDLGRETSELSAFVDITNGGLAHDIERREASHSISMAEIFHSSAVQDLSRETSSEQVSGQDQKKCRRLLQHLVDVGEQDGLQLAESTEDPLFPPMASSIASADDVCTDVNGVVTPCVEYDWGRIPTTLERAAEVMRCIATKVDQGRCHIKNVCRTSIELHWFPEVLAGDGGDRVWSFPDENDICKDNLPEDSFNNWVEEVPAMPAHWRRWY